MDCLRPGRVLLVLLLCLYINQVAQALPAAAQNLLPIGAIQGSGEVSPLVDSVVTFRGVVTGFYEDQNTQGVTYYTAFLQDLPETADRDPATSDGIAVFLGRRRPSLAPGDYLRVTGTVTEFFGLTEIDDRGAVLHVEARGLPLPPPLRIDPPAGNEAQAAYFERLEGMRVAFDGAARVIGPTHSGCGFAVVSLAASPDRLLRRQESDGVGQAVPVLHSSDVRCDGFPDVKRGDTVAGLAGPLTYHFDQFKLVQQDVAALAVTAVPLAPPPRAGLPAVGHITLASLNLQNYFDTIDDTGSDAEPKPAAAEIAARQAKIAYAISQTLACPTVIGIQEVEKAALLHDLARSAAACGFTYAVTHLDSPDVRGIDVALLSDPRQVTILAARLEQTCSAVPTEVVDPAITCPAGANPLFSRPPLRVEAEVSGRPLTILINHFKSKRGGAAVTAPQRLAQAAHINALAAARLAREPQAALVVMGDFNDYELSPALRAMTVSGARPAGRLLNVLSRVPASERFTFVFGGASQLLDGLLISPALSPLVTAVTILHVNADYPEAWAHDLSPDRLPFRATDHDLPLLTLAWTVPAFALTPPPAAAPAPATLAPPSLPGPASLPAATALPAAAPTAVPVTGFAPPPDRQPDQPAGNNGWWLTGLLATGLLAAALWTWRRPSPSGRQEVKEREMGQKT